MESEPAHLPGNRRVHQQQQLSLLYDLWVTPGSKSSNESAYMHSLLSCTHRVHVCHISVTQTIRMFSRRLCALGAVLLVFNEHLVHLNTLLVVTV